MSMYLDIASIQGESSSENPNWNKKIEIEVMSYDIHQRTSVETGSGLIAGGSQVGTFSISKVMDRSTPMLFYHLAGGLPIPSVVVRVSRSGANSGPGVFAGGNFEAETYVLENVIVTSYHTSGVLGAGGLPEENWCFTCTKLTERYQTVGADGMLMSPEIAGYDFGGGTEYSSAMAAQAGGCRR